jgi:hypothetical protein
MDELDRNQRYIVYCNADYGRATVAKLILDQKQADVVSLDRGIHDRPLETASVEDAVAQTNKQLVNAR